MNFGHKIAMAYAFFVVFIITLVVVCVKNKDIFLVSNDYYKQELAYQGEIDKMANVAQLSSPIQFHREGDKMVIQFPEEVKEAKGEIVFYRPSNANLDFTLPLHVSSNLTQVVPVGHLVNGQWVIKMEFTQGGKVYFKEQKVVI